MHPHIRSSSLLQGMRGGKAIWGSAMRSPPAMGVTGEVVFQHDDRARTGESWSLLVEGWLHGRRTCPLPLNSMNPHYPVQGWASP